MRKFKALLLFIISSTVFASGIPWKPQTDVGQLGRASSVDPVELFFDVGDGASNPVLSVDKTAKTFDLSKPTRVQGDISIGDGTPSDRNLVIDEGAGGNNPRLTWDTVTNKWKQFDGTSERVIGSGTGGAGGQNFFADKNPDAEGGTNNWTVTGTGTFSTFTSTPINGLTSFRWDSDLIGDILRTDQIEIPEKFKGQSCQIEFSYSGLLASSDLIKPQVVDSSNVKLPGATYRNQLSIPTDFLQAQTGIVTRSIFFICPSSGTIAFEFNQTVAGNPAIMDFDDVFIGELIGLQTTVITGAWTSYTPTITGFGTPTAIDFQFRVIGDSVEINGTFTSGTATAVEAQVSLPNSGTVLSTSVSPIAVGGTWFRGFATTVNGGAALITPGDAFMNFSAALVFGATTVDAMVVADGDEMVASGHEVVVHATVPIEGQSATPVKIFNSIPKVAENINTFSARFDGSAGAGVTVVSESSPFVSSIVRNSVGDFTVNFIAGIFTVPPEVTSMIETPTGTIGKNSIIDAPTTSSVLVHVGTAGVAVTDEDFGIMVQKQGVDFKLPTVQPILVNQVETTIASGVRVESCDITNSGTPVTTGTMCDNWIDSITDGGVGFVTLNFTAGTFSELPVCTCNCVDPYDCGGNNKATLTTFPFITRHTTTGAASDQICWATCVGKR